MAVRIICIKREKGVYENPWLAINYVEWVNERVNVNGITERAKIHDWIKDLDGEAYIIDPTGKKILLIPATSPGGNKYVKTGDDETIDFLLSLPECI